MISELQSDLSTALLSLSTSGKHLPVSSVLPMQDLELFLIPNSGTVAVLMLLQASQVDRKWLCRECSFLTTCNKQIAKCVQPPKQFCSYKVICSRLGGSQCQECSFQLNLSAFWGLLKWVMNDWSWSKAKCTPCERLKLFQLHQKMYWFFKLILKYRVLGPILFHFFDLSEMGLMATLHVSNR